MPRTLARHTPHIYKSAHFPGKIYNSCNAYLTPFSPHPLTRQSPHSLKYENFLQKNLIVSPIILLYTQVEKISLGNYNCLSFPTFNENHYFKSFQLFYPQPLREIRKWPKTTHSDQHFQRSLATDKKPYYFILKDNRETTRMKRIYISFLKFAKKTTRCTDKKYQCIQIYYF